MILSTTTQTIEINLAYPGVYKFWRISASGKTLLAKTLDIISEFNKDIVSVGFQSGADIIIKNKIPELTINPPKLLFIDRFDFYKTDELSDCINKISDKTIVLLDLKNTSYDKVKIDSIVDLVLEDGKITIW